MKTIGVLGAGWLGLPLTKHLISKGFLVKASVTSELKKNHLKQQAINAFNVVLSEFLIEGNICNFLEDLEVLIIAIPPKSHSCLLQNKIKTLYQHPMLRAQTKIIFISSTSVFEDQSPFAVYYEQSNPNASNFSSIDLINTEKFISHQKNPWIILRFGGLIGVNRHPVKYLSQKPQNLNPKAPVNLIDQSDCIRLIEAIINFDKYNVIYHGVNPNHPSRLVYYTQKAELLGYPIPNFSEQTVQIGKTILAEKTSKILNFCYISNI